ncbi:MAG: tetratricopeptide repeat protein [Anaerolineae bacterium]|nr:tetratricopeptide repeat protein [Anaerolineae bacterium]
MSADLRQKLQDAIALAQSGQRHEARGLLEQVIDANPDEELAWLWLATVSTDKAERVQFLEKALALNPDNPTSQQAYAQLTGTVYAAPPPVERPGIPVSERAAGLVRRLTQDSPLSPVHFFILMGVVTMFVVGVLLVVNLVRGDGDKKDDAGPTATPYVIIRETDTPTPYYTYTPSDTPYPTNTPGPSPTPLILPPTWTPSPTWTLHAPNTLVPSWTPGPTRTHTPTFPPLTATFTPIPPDNLSQTPQPNAETATARFALTSDAPSSTETPLPTPSPNAETATASFAQTSDAISSDDDGS